MNKTTLTSTTFRKGLLSVVAGIALAACSTNSFAQTIKALSDGKLYTFEATAPAVLIGSPLIITGLGSGQSLVGMDYRPNKGELIALGYNSTTGMGRLYVLNTSSGAATALGTADFAIDLGTGPVGLDFNPTVDRIRVVAANNKNYRLNPNTGTLQVTDGDLKYAVSDANAGKNPFIGTCAYTNSYIGATATALYDYDDSLAVFSKQDPPNDGILNSIGASGISVNAADRSTDMDIYFNPTTSTNTAYLSANPDGSVNDNLYTVNLTTGATTSLGMIGTGLAVTDIAVVIDRTLPSLTGKTIYGLTYTNAGANNNLISFSSDNPSVIRSLATVTGLKTGQRIVGMDFRPVDRKLYALGQKPGTDSVNLYTINTETGVATVINDTTFKLTGVTGNISFDFNPVADRIRVISANGKSFRLNQLTGKLAAKDSSLSYKTGDVNFGKSPFVGSCAYTRSFAGTKTTQLFDIDDSLNVLALQAPPNDGILATIGSIGISLNKADLTSDLDIAFTASDSSNTAFFAANIGSESNDNLYTMNLASGATTLIGRIGLGSAVRDIAVLPESPVAGIQDQQKVDYALSIYPNPSSGMASLSFTLPKSGKAQVRIFDLSGKLVSVVEEQSFAAGNNQVSLPLNGLAKGTYLITLTVDQQAQNIQKLIVE